MWVPKILSSHLPGSQALLAGVSFPLAALARRSSPVVSSPACPLALGGSGSHHCSHPWALASPMSHQFPPVSHRANSRAYLPAAL